VTDNAQVVLCPTCLHDGVLERALVRAEAAEAKLAAIEAKCRDKISHPECGQCGRGEALIGAEEILAVIGIEEAT
jgi:hypothetical protein